MSKAKIILKSQYGERYDQVWHFTKHTDSVHLFISSSPEHKGSPYHVAEVKDQPYYNDVVAWLNGEKDINNNCYQSTEL